MLYSLKITIVFVFILIDLSYGQQQNNLWIQKSDLNENNYLYVGIYSSKTKYQNDPENFFIQKFLYVREKLSSYKKQYGIQLGFVDCEFLSNYPVIYETKFKHEYCSTDVVIDDKLLLFNEENFLYEMESKSVSSLELFQSNILTTRIEQTFDLIHFRNIEDYQFLLNSLIEDDKSKQDIILIHLSDELNDKTFRERKRLLEVVYKYAIDNRFIFVYDQDIFEKIKEDFDIGNVNIIKFKCKYHLEKSFCPIQISNEEGIKSDTLLKLIKQNRIQDKLDYDGDLNQMFDLCQDCSMITYFYKKEDEKYQEFQIFASNKSNNGVLLSTYNMTKNKISRIDKGNIDNPILTDSFLGIYIKHLDLFERIDINLLDLEDIYQRLVSYNEFSEWKIESSDDPTYEFLNNNLAVLTVKNDLKKYFTVLTEDTFYKTLESKRITFVFFYLPWEKESLKDANYLIDLAKIWANYKQRFALLNCFDYSDFCSNKLNIIKYPFYKFYRSDQLVGEFNYIPEYEVFMNYFTKYFSRNPIELKSDQDIQIFLRDGFKIMDESILERLALMEKKMEPSFSLRVSNRIILFLRNISAEHRTLVELLMDKFIFGVVDCDFTPELCPCENICIKIKHNEQIFFQNAATESIQKLNNDYLTYPSESSVQSIVEFLDSNSKQKILNYKNDAIKTQDGQLNVLLMANNVDKNLSKIVQNFYNLASSKSLSDINFYILDITNRKDPLSNLFIKYSRSFISPALVLVEVDNNKVKTLKYKNDLTDYVQLDYFIKNHKDIQHQDTWISINEIKRTKESDFHDEL